VLCKKQGAKASTASAWKPNLESIMKRELRNSVLAVLTAAFVALTIGCQTLQSPGLTMEPLENYGGGGGGDNS
jgi:hypothetical protein